MGDEAAEEVEVAVVAVPVAKPELLESCMKGADNKVENFLKKNPDDAEKLLNTPEAYRSEKMGWTPLQVATGYNREKVVKVLLDAGCKVNVPDKMGMTAIHTGADCDEVLCLKMLLAADDGKAAINNVDEDGCTALHYAAHANREDAVIALLRAGAATDVANSEGKLAVDLAKEQKLQPIVELITNGPPAEEAAEEAAAE